MTLRQGLALAAVLSTAAGSVQAQDIGFGGDVAVVSEYISSGVTQSSGRPALQFTGYGYTQQGIYAGVFLSTVNFTTFDPADRDRLELGLFVGWERSFANGLTLDLRYERYLYNSSGDCCGIFYVSASGFVSDQLELAALVQYDHTSDTFDTRGTVTVYPTDALGLRVSLGRSQANSHNYMTVGVDYSFTDALTGSLEFHRASSSWTRDRLVAGLRYTF